MQRHTLSILAAVFAASTVCAQVVNDECSGAITIVDGINNNGGLPFTNVGSSTSSPAWTCALGGSDVWFLYSASCSGTLTVDTCSPNTNYDTAIQVFDVNCGQVCGTLTTGTCNDDFCGLQSSVSAGAILNGLYYIRVGGFNGGSGDFELNVVCTPGGGGGVPDDECSGATPLTLGPNGPFSTVGYTTSVPGWLCAIGGSDRWFQYQATCTAPHTFYTCSPNTDYDTAIELFAGSCACLTSLGCNDDTCGLQSSVTGLLTQGSTYFVRVGGFASGTGNVELTVAIGTNTGSTTTYADACGGTTISVSGNPNIAGSVTTTLGGLGFGVPFLGYGFVRNGTNFCSTCNIGHDFAVVTAPPGGTETLLLPCDPALIGGSLFVQGIELGGAGGCPGLGNVSDTVEIVIG